MRTAIERRGWELVEVIEDAGWSAKDLRRPGIKTALEVLEAGDAKALVVAKLDRLSRSLLDFAGLMAKAQRQGWGVIALDVQVDTSTASGEAMANMLATFAQFERRLIVAADEGGARDEAGSGVRLGRPPTLPQAVVDLIQRQRARGETLRAIADGLNRTGWRPLRAASGGTPPRAPRVAEDVVIRRGVGERRTAPLPRPATDRWVRLGRFDFLDWLVRVDLQDLAEARDRRAESLVRHPEVTVWSHRHAGREGQPGDDGGLRA